MGEYFDPAYSLETGLFDSRIIIALAAVALGGFLRGFTGFGGALVIVPVLSILFTPREAVAMHVVMEIPGVLQLMPTAVRHAERKIVLPMLAALLVTTPIGVLLLVLINQDTMRIVISVAVLLMVGLLAGNWRYAGSPRPGVTVATGIVSGLAQGATGIGGPPIVVMLLSHDVVADSVRANVIAMMGSLTLVALPVLWAYGLLTPPVLLVGAISAFVYFGTVYLGTRFYAGRGKELYRRVSLAVLAAIALTTLLAALT
ncbi:MAG: sulfite exporter TauE/SafE family protein [Hyphomicrobiales bacterium]|nr:sulfite exporter TauE/SafE family protein [Hyphomicrobiales bacterium]